MRPTGTAVAFIPGMTKRSPFSSSYMTNGASSLNFAAMRGLYTSGVSVTCESAEMIRPCIFHSRSKNVSGKRTVGIDAVAPRLSDQGPVDDDRLDADRVRD